VARFSCYVPGARGKRRRRETVHVASLAEAKARWRAFVEKVHHEAEEPGVIPTLKQFVDRSFHLIEASVAPSTARDYLYVVRKHLLPAFGAMKLAELSTGLVNRFSAGLLASGYSPWSVHNYTNVLQLLIGYAVEFGVIDSSPLKTRPKRYKLEKPCNELSDDEERRLLAAFDDEDGFRTLIEKTMPRGARSQINDDDGDAFGGHRAHGAGLRGDSDATGSYFRRYQRSASVFIIALDSGLRLSDYRLLRWSQVDLDQGLISIIMRKTRRRVIVPLSDRALAILRHLRSEGSSSEFVLVDLDGHPYGVQRLRRYLRMAMSMAGFASTRRLRLHDLRHSMASKLARRGTPLLHIRDVLGHTSVSTTQRYARIDDVSLRSVLAALNRDEIR